MNNNLQSFGACGINEQCGQRQKYTVCSFETIYSTMQVNKEKMPEFE